MDPAPSPSPAQPEADHRLPLVEKFDKYAIARNKLRRISERAGEWAGLPMEIEGENPLVIDRSYKWAHIFNESRDSREERQGKALEAEGYKLRNLLWSSYYRVFVWVHDCPDGRVRCTPVVGTGNSLDLELGTMGSSVAWGIEQESTALKLLGTLLPHHQFKYYLMTGMFVESSKRSGVIYLFRKLRPTVAITTKKHPGKLSILAALCMHPIGYYQHTWAGAMCPTDDVVAHLMLMRGDEKMFWRRCNQHPAGRPGSGV